MTEERSFGNDIGNTMTASQPQDSNSDVVLLNDIEKNPLPGEKSMDGETIASGPKDILSKALAVEVYSLIQHNTSNYDDLLEEIEDLLDDTFYNGEIVYHAGVEHEIKSKEKRGGLVQYVMVDGSKINHRDLKRKKGLNMEFMKELVNKNAKFDGKMWQVRDEVKKVYPLKEKLAPIFCTNSQKGGKKENENKEASSSSSEEDIEDEVKVVFQGRASAGASALTNRKSLQKAEEKKKLKEQKEKEKAEKKQKQMEEKKKKQLEEKQKQLEEKQLKKGEQAKKKDAKKEATNKKVASNGKMDKFVTKNGADESGAENGAADKKSASVSSPGKWSAQRVNGAVKKLEEAWTKRDVEMFNETCAWCEKQLSGKQIASIENEIFRFSIQKLVDKTKDKLALKNLKGEKKQEYRNEMLEKRKDLYKRMEPRIRSYFNEEVIIDDLLLNSNRLALPNAEKFDGDEELIRCIEITQFFVSMRKILAWNEKISAMELKNSLYEGIEGFKRCGYKMLKNLIETTLDEESYWHAAHLFIRISEYPMDEYSVTDILQAVLKGDTRTTFDWRIKLGENPNKIVESDDEEETVEEVKAEETQEDGEKGEEEEEEEEEVDVRRGGEDVEELGAENKDKVLELFDGRFFYEWEASKQLEALEALIEVVLELPIVQEWFVRDAISDAMVELRNEQQRITAKIEDETQQLNDMPKKFKGDLEALSRQESKRISDQEKRREKLVKSIELLKGDLENISTKMAIQKDDFARTYRAICMGEDRHFRRYYWFAYSPDAGVWVQDFGETSYEKWARQCRAAGVTDFDAVTDYSVLPEYVEEEIKPGNWYKITGEENLKELENRLMRYGRRERMLRKYIHNNFNDILASIEKDGPLKKSASPYEEDEAMEDEKPDYTGPFGTLKTAMRNLLQDLVAANITTIKDVDEFESKLENAGTMDQVKQLMINLIEGIHTRVIIVKFEHQIMFEQRKFSYLLLPKFYHRIKMANSVSSVHMLLGYLESRIDFKKSLDASACTACRKKQSTERKLGCSKCSDVYHFTCLVPVMSKDDFNDEEVRNGWKCPRCLKEEQRVKRENKVVELSDSDDEDEEEEIEGVRRSRKAKRKAFPLMKEMQDILYNHRRPKPISGAGKKRTLEPEIVESKKRVPEPEIVELYNSLEKMNPRMFKLLLNIPLVGRSTRDRKEVWNLPTIEQYLGAYTNTDELRKDMNRFLHSAREHMENHNSRKIDELDSLISEFESTA